MFGILLLCVLFCACVYALRSRVLESRAHALPPALPGGLPVIGHMLLLICDTTRLWEILKNTALDCVKRGGVTYGNFGEIYYIIADPEDALTVANSCLQKHFWYSFAKYWLGQGLITSSGAIWHRHRKLLNPVFTLPVIHGFLEVFNTQSKDLVCQMESFVNKGPFDPSMIIRSIALKISCLTAFGTNEDRKDKLFFSKYMKAVDGILYSFINRFQKIWLHYNLIYSLLGFRKKEDELVKTLNSMSDEIIKEKRALIKAGKIKEYKFDDETTGLSYTPILDLILQQANKEPMTDQEIREEVDTTIVAGFETSSHLVDCVMVMIGSYPEIQERMYEEIIQVIGEDRDVAKEDLQKLVYTDAVIKESLRVIPVVPAIGRYIDRDIKLKNCTLRANSQCLLLPIGIHRHPSWGPDADQFKPERWLDTATLPKNSNAFAAFSIGKRSCIGRTYAMTSVKVTLAHLLRKFRVTADQSKLQFKLDVTLKAVAGNEISLQLRH